MLPVCDHYSGVEVRMRKSLELQASLAQEFGAVVFDVTLDGEDGAPVGGELDHAELIASLVNSPLECCMAASAPVCTRCGTRLSRPRSMR